MAEYWPKRLGVVTASTLGPASAADAAREDADADDEDEDDFDAIRRRRLNNGAAGGWRAELQRYLNDPFPDVTKDTDTVKWWQVRLQT